VGAFSESAHLSLVQCAAAVRFLGTWPAHRTCLEQAGAVRPSGGTRFAAFTRFEGAAAARTSRSMITLLTSHHCFMVLFFGLRALDWSIGHHDAFFSLHDFSGAFIGCAATTSLPSFNCDDGSVLCGDFPLALACGMRAQKSLASVAAGLEAHFPLGLHHLALLHSASAFGSCLNDFVDVVFNSSAFDWSIGDHGALISFGHLRDASRFRRLRRAFATNFTSFNDFNVVLGSRECDNGRKDEELSHG